MNHSSDSYIKWLDQSVPLYDYILSASKEAFRGMGESHKFPIFKGELTQLFELIDPTHTFRLSTFEQKKHTINSTFSCVKVVVFESGNEMAPNLILELDSLIKNKLNFYKDLEKEFKKIKKGKKESGNESSVD